jgi:hypothetical protein
LVFPITALAASGSNQPVGIGISPTYQNVTIGNSQPSATYYMTLANNTTVAESFKLSTVDFGSLNDSGGVAFLGDSSGSFAQKYGLAKWMTLGESALIISPGASEKVSVTVNNAPSLSVGGHYGAVLATVNTTSSANAPKSRVGVIEVLSSLILLIKAGGPMPDLQLISEKLNANIFEIPTDVSTKFQNEGDVHVVPRGIVEIHDPTGRIVARTSINIGSGIILPSTVRQYSTPLMRLAASRLPGYYHAVTTYRYDGTMATKTFTTGFWYIGSESTWGIWLVLFSLLVAGAWVIKEHGVRWWRKRHL